MKIKKDELGQLGEDLAAKYLINRGFKILQRNYKIKLGEIDIIAQDKDTVCFIEVKARTSLKFGTAFESVSKHKQEKISKVALSYLQQNDLNDVKVRFDVIAIDLKDKNCHEIDMIENAFEFI